MPARHVMTLAAAAMFCAAALAEPSTPTPRDLRAAACVAALQVQAEALAQQIKAGAAEQRKLLQERLLAGTAFVGDVYLHSKITDEQARALANEALQAQKSLPADELAERQNGCAAEGTKIYNDGNGVQQMVVQRMANRRMAKLLGN